MVNFYEKKCFVWFLNRKDKHFIWFVNMSVLHVCWIRV